MLLLTTQLVFFWEIHVFHQLSWTGLVESNRVYQHFETPKLQEVFLSKLTQVSQGNNVLNAPASNKGGSLWRDSFVYSTYLIGQFGTNSGIVHIENNDLQEVFLSKTNSILTAKQCTDALGSKKMAVFTDVYVF
jgi:hypothetical protein